MSRQRDLLVEQVRRRKAQDTKRPDKEKGLQLLDSLFPAQRAFVLDPSRRKVAHCPRRAGKSHCVLVYGLIVGLTRPNSSVLICARTRGQAKGIYWRLLKQICEEYAVRAVFKNMDLECHLSNGSVIAFSGADTSEEVDKYRGRSFDLVVIDEGKSYAQALLDEFVFEVIQRTLADRRGTLVVIGTPGSVEAGLFWSLITLQARYRRTGDERDAPLHAFTYKQGVKRSVFHWSKHHWTTLDNTCVPHIHTDAMQELEDKELTMDDPYVQREYFGIPVADSSQLVFCYGQSKDGRNDWTRDATGPHGLPAGHEWRFVLGVDLGWHDATAFVVAAWSPTHKALHLVHEEKHPYLLTDSVVARVRALEDEFGGFDARIVDPAAGGKRLAEDLSQIHGLYFESAKKSDKNAYVALLNADMRSGKVVIDPRGLLAQELRILQWKDHEKTEIDRGSGDDLADAFLYTWRFCHHHYATDKKSGPEQGSAEWKREQRRKEMAQLQEERASQNGDLWQRYGKRLNRLPSAARKSARWMS